MLLRNKKITFAITNCVYRFENIVKQIDLIVEEKAEIFPVLSYYAFKNNEIKKYMNRIESACKKKVIFDYENIHNLKEDIMIIAPCSRKYNRKTC